MIIHPEPQGSLEWSLARAGIVTASEFHNVVTSEFELRTGEMMRSYLAAKVAEKWMGSPLDGFGSWATEQGQLLEEESRRFVNLEFNQEIERVGLITTDDGKCGCSPDGLIKANGTTSGVEIKAPQPLQHVKTVLGREVPTQHLAQIHFGMYVTGFVQWKFVSYHRAFPQFVLTVERDEEIQEKISEAVACFLVKFDLAMEQMTDRNGGPPPKRTLTPMPERAPREPFLSEMPS